jgi:hypothetical protein
VRHHLREAIFASFNPPDPLPPPEHHLDESDQAILLALADQSSASIRKLSRLTDLPTTTVHRRLTQFLGFVCAISDGYPFFATLSKARSSEVVTTIFLMLEPQERRSWHGIVTLDESWFYLHTDHELIWAQPDAEIPERERHPVQSQT